MFDIGFSEIMVIAVVALIVIGPEKLPKTARTLGHLFGRLQRYVSDVKADINREIELDELRKLQQQVQTAAKDIETSMTSAAHEVESSVRTVASELNAAAEGPKAEASPVDMRPLAAPAPEKVQIESPRGSRVAAPSEAPPPAEPPRQASLPGFDRG